MRTWIVILAAFLLPAVWAAETVVVCPIKDMIDEGVAVVVERAIREAGELNATAIIFKIDTPGGRVDSAVKIASAITEAPCKTIAYVTGMGAVSAGALISYACDEIVMTPGSVMGDAQPVIPSAQGMLPTGEKEVSFVRTKMRALAERTGQNPDIAEAMVDSDIELRALQEEDGTYRVYVVHGSGPRSAAPSPSPEQPSFENTAQQVIEKIIDRMSGKAPQPASPPAEATPEPLEETEAAATAADGSIPVIQRGKLLTLTYQDALKYGVIPTVVESLEETAAFFDLGEIGFHQIEINWAEKFFRWVTSPTVAGLLMMLGMGGLYFEVKTPGFGVPGLIAVICLALFFGSHYVLGLTETIDIILVVSGIILLLVEIFVIPGFGVAGIAGLLCLVVGLYLSLVDFTVPEFSWQFDRLREVMYSLSVAAVTFVVFVIATWKLLPYTPVYSGFVLAGEQRAEDGYSVQGEEDFEVAIGLKGSASSMLRPAGRARFGDKTYTVVSRGDFIEPGTPIEIVEVEGNRYVVERVPGEDA